ncbi:unannotated protein [freshwater metagenome]|uniref:Unannotated protein n=1 Tax=freshwater metagenome TaxID=449393 RepID=A0A6J6UTI1_9ZZZZ
MAACSTSWEGAGDPDGSTAADGVGDGVGVAEAVARGVALGRMMLGTVGVRGASGRTESRGSCRGGRITMPTILSVETSANGRMVAIRVSCPAVPATLTTSPMGIPGE